MGSSRGSGSTIGQGPVDPGVPALQMLHPRVGGYLVQLGIAGGESWQWKGGN